MDPGDADVTSNEVRGLLQVFAGLAGAVPAQDAALDGHPLRAVPALAWTGFKGAAQAAQLRRAITGNGKGNG